MKCYKKESCLRLFYVTYSHYMPMNAACNPVTCSETF